MAKTNSNPQPPAGMTFVNVYISASSAQQIAASLRARGYETAVTKHSGGYALWKKKVEPCSQE